MAGLGAIGGGGLFAGPSIAALGAGLLAGVVGGTALVATGTVEFGGAPAGSAGASGAVLELVPCPDQGPVIGTIPQGQEVLVTARSADGGWLQLYWPAPGIERAWTPAGPLQLEGDAAALPVAACEAPPTPTPRPTVEPMPTPEVTPTPTPTPEATPTPTPVPTAKNTKPKLSRLTASTASISFDQGDYCPNAPTSVTISVAASDPEGIASVTLRFRPPGTSGFLEKQMRLSNGRYVATLDTTTDNLRRAGDLAYYVVASDRAADQQSARLPAKATSLAVKVCKNTGPKITDVGASPSTIFWNPPVGLGCSASASDVTARVADVDGLDTVRLHFRFNGGAWQQKAMEPNVVRGKWYANLDTLGDKFTSTSGRIDYYVRAVDKTGLASKSAAKKITVKYCDDEANFSSPGSTSSVGIAVGKYPSIFGQISVTDRNATSSRQLKVTISWQLLNANGKAVLAGKTAASWDGPFYWGVETGPSWLEALGSQAKGTFRWWAVSTDPYGGTTDSRKQLTTPTTDVFTR